MAGIQRFVTYIYAYDDGVKTSNTGYAKMEIRGATGRMELHFMDASILSGRGEVAFTYVSEEGLHQIPVGNFLVERGLGTATFSFAVENIAESGKSFGDMDGICIMGSNQRLYLSLWKDVKQEEFRLKQEDILEEAEQESLHTMEIPIQNVFPTFSMEEIWELLKPQKENVALEENVEGLRIELKDLRELPQKYWYLGNNSFLLTSFFNYHYLLLGKLADGRWFIGVPGGCSRQERIVAPVFGFPSYLPEGIWYHILED